MMVVLIAITAQKMKPNVAIWLKDIVLLERNEMNIDNRRLKEIQAEKLVWQDQLAKAESMSECLTFKGKLDILEKEEKEILERSGVYE